MNMDAGTLQLIMRLQLSLCELLIYVNRTSDYAQRARAVARDAAEVLREHGKEAIDVPGLPERTAYATHTHSVTI